MLNPSPFSSLVGKLGKRFLADENLTRDRFGIDRHETHFKIDSGNELRKSPNVALGFALWAKCHPWGERERESSQVDKWRGEKAVKILPTAKSIRITIAVPSADVIVHGVFEQYLAWLSQNQPTYTAFSL